MITTPQARGAGRSRTRRALHAVVGLTLVVVGAVLVQQGLQTRTAPPAPLPAKGFAIDDPGPIAPSGLLPDQPNQLVIPSLGVRAPLVPEAVSDGQLGIPEDVSLVGLWADGGRLDGTEGTVLTAGHVHWAGQGDGALKGLATLQPGAVVHTSDGSGEISWWQVISLEGIVKQALPAHLYEATGPRRLAVVTCGGPVSRDAQGRLYYRDNVVAIAVPVEPAEQG